MASPVFARTFALTWLIYSGFYLCRKNFSVLMPFLKSEQGYSSQQLAEVLFCYSLAYSGGQFLNGMLSDRWGARLVVTTGAMVSAASSALTGLAGPLFLLQGVNGLAQSSGWPGVLKLSQEWFPKRNRAVVMAWWGTHLVVGGFVATSVASKAVQQGWMRGAWLPALGLVAIGSLFGLLARDYPRNPDGRSGSRGRGRLQLNRTLVAIAAMYFCVKLTRYAFLFWLPLYMTEALRYSPVEAGFASAAFELVGFGGVLFAGYASDRAAGGRRFPVATVMMLILAGFCLAYPLASRVGVWLNLAAIGMVGAFTFGPDTLMAGPGTQEAAPPDATASAAGFVNGVGSMGQIVSPLLVAAVAGSWGWDAMFMVLGGASMAGAVALATQWRN